MTIFSGLFTLIAFIMLMIELNDYSAWGASFTFWHACVLLAGVASIPNIAMGFLEYLEAGRTDS